MNIITRVKNAIFKKHTVLLPTKALITLTKKQIKKNKYQPIPIMFHHVSENAGNYLSVSKETLEQTILFFKKHGFNFLFEKDYYTSKSFSVILTFDDGYRDNYTNLFPLLKKHNVKASVNIIAEKIIDKSDIDYLDIEQIKEMIDSGLVQIQPHSYSHKKLTECSEAELEIETAKAKKLIEDHLGVKCSVLVAPYLQNSQEVVLVAKKYYDLIYSDSVKGVENRYCIPRIGLHDNVSERQLARYLCIKTRNVNKN